MIYSKSINFKVTYTFKESHLLLDCLTPSSSKLIRSFRLSLSLSLVVRAPSLLYSIE